MRISRFVRSAIAFVAVAVAVPVLSQVSLGPLEAPNIAASVGDPTHMLRSSVDMVLVPVTVLDARERLVMDLRADAFSLYQDGRQQEIRYFATNDGPISVALVLDLSGSMRNKFSAEQDALREFCNNANAQDEYSIVTFSDQPKLIAASTQSVDALESRLAREKPKGDTAMLDAIWDAADSLRSARYDRRRVLVISDGGDNHSRHSLGQLRKHLAESDVAVYAIGIFDYPPFKTWEESMGRKWLSQFTDATGGRTVAVGKETDLVQAAGRISREMREQYVLGYRPSLTQSSPTHPKIQVKVSPPPGTPPVRALYKTGYTADAALR